MGRAKTTLEIINEFRDVHGCSHYDYSCVSYKTAHDHVDIICRIHGLFKMTPHHHKKGFGCRRCAGFVLDRESFVFKSSAVHNGKYRYNLTVYNGPKKKVAITCPIHGVFHQSPNDHYSGKGCAKCGYKKVAEDLRGNTNDFVKKARSIHGNKYVYLKTNYVSNHEKVEVICPLHGLFVVAPSNHVSGKCGCPICARIENIGNLNPTVVDRNKDLLRSKKGFLYLLSVCADRNIYKIGITNDVKRRISHLDGDYDNLVFSKESNMYDSFIIEQKLFELFRGKRITYGTKGGRTEHFILTDEDVEFITML